MDRQNNVSKFDFEQRLMELRLRVERMLATCLPDSLVITNKEKVRGTNTGVYKLSIHASTIVYFEKKISNKPIIYHLDLNTGDIFLNGVQKNNAWIQEFYYIFIKVIDDLNKNKSRMYKEKNGESS